MMRLLIWLIAILLMVLLAHALIPIVLIALACKIFAGAHRWSNRKGV